MDPHIVSIGVVLLSVVCLTFAIGIGYVSRSYRIIFSTSGAEVRGIAYLLCLAELVRRAGGRATWKEAQ